jgi:hypothetical protein
VTTFAWDWATGVPELLSDGDKRYLVGHDTLGWEDAGGHVLSEVEGWTYAVPDALGSVRQAVDALGIDRLYLFTPDQVPFYRRLGWAPLARTHYRGEDVQIMVYEM